MKKIHIYIPVLTVLIVIFFSPILFTLNNIVGNFGDIYLHYYPLKHLVSENIISGKMPLWNPYIFAGQPLLANPQSAVFYPLSIVFYIAPIHLAFNYFITLHFLLAGIFMYLLLSYYRFSNSASIICSITYVFSSFLVYRVPAGHPAAISGYIWLPLVIFLLENLQKSDSYLYLCILSLVLSYQYLSGHIQPIYISAVFILIHFTYNKFRYWRNLLIAGFITIVLSSIQLIPSLELSQVAETLKWQTLAESYSLPLKNLINLFLPNFYGNIVNGDYIHQLNPSYFFELHSLYIGVIPILLSIAGFFIYVKTKKLFWPLIIFISLFLSLGFNNPLYRSIYWLVPGLQFIRVPARFSYLLITGFIILFAAAWDKYIKNFGSIFKSLIMVMIILDLFGCGMKYIYSQDINNYRKKDEVSGYIYPMYRIITEPGILPANKSMLYHHYNLNGYETIFLQDFTRYIGLQEKGIMSPTGLARMDIHSPLASGLSARYLISIDPIADKDVFMCFKSGLKLYRLNKALPLVYFAKTIRVLPEVSGYDQINYLKNTKLPPEEEIIVGTIPENFPRFTENSKVISFKQFSGRSITEVLMNAPGTMVFSEIYYSGWKAYVENKEVKLFRGNKVFKTLFLYPDKNNEKFKIYLYFQPVSYYFGMYLTLISILVLLLFFMLRGLSHSLEDHVDAKV